MLISLVHDPLPCVMEERKVCVSFEAQLFVVT